MAHRGRPERGSFDGSPQTRPLKGPAAATAGVAAMSLAESKDNPFNSLASKTKVAALMHKDRKVIEIVSTDNIVNAFQTIVANKVLSAPVWDEEVKRYIGFLDTRDLTQYVTFMEDEKAKEKEAADDDKLKPPEMELANIFDAAARMFPQAETGITIKYLARRNRFVAVTSSDNVLKVVQLMSQAGIHRVGVVDGGTKKCQDIISQSSIVKFIWENREAMAAMLAPTVDSVKLGSRPVSTVKETDSALEAFRIMAKYNRSGVAVVDKDGRFVGNTSGSDLKLFIQNPGRNSKTLRVPIMEFLSVIRRSELKTKSPTIVVGGSSNIESVIGKLFATRVHRVFVAEDAKGFKPEAVISLTDVLNHLLRSTDHTKIKVDTPAA